MAKSNRKRLEEMQPPERFVDHVQKAFPRAWEQVERFRAYPPKPWPHWCYIPIAATYAIATNGANVNEAKEILATIGVQWPAMIAAAAAWRKTKGVYRFDKDLARELMEQPISGEIPVEVFLHLPEWCVYIELPDEDKYIGLFAHLEYDIKTQGQELRFVFLDKNEAPTTMVLMLEKTIEKSWQALLRSAKEQYPDLPDIGGELDWLIPYIQLILYLCSANADMPPIPNPFNRIKTGHNILPMLRTWDVGTRIGAAIRASREAPSDPAQGSLSGARHAPRAHLRRAHWHHYWVGSGRTKLELRWIAPTFVGDTENLPTTIRPVKK
ncbi:hypothetical protein LJC42_00380 [Eubacteriales bacterium OttesenSCG-928-K08]|nr:hypothetical protein [Eubacteriales bacterium OttesenSCG-928-K08]